MAIVSDVITVGTAAETIVPASGESQRVAIYNLEPANRGEDYARAGYSYVIQQQVTIVNAGTAIFSVTTGSTGFQIQGYELVSTIDTVKADLIEGATITTSGSAIPGYNLNRNFSDAHAATFYSATAATGGTVVASELVTANKQGGGGSLSLSKIHTLEPNTQYALRFVNQGNQTTSMFIQIVWVEKFNGENDLWLSGTVGDGYRVKAGEKFQLDVRGGESITAIANHDIQVALWNED